MSERCVAMLDYIYHWRCTRPARARGLCWQHDRLGARVPESWDHTPRGYEKVACHPHPPFRFVPPAGETERSWKATHR